MYELIMRQLADQFFLVAPDTPGFGNSDALRGDPASHRVGDYAAAINELVTGLGIAPCYVFGHHTGAAIAVQLEYDHPGTARAMALSGPTLLDESLKCSLPQLAAPFPLAEDGSHLQGMWRRIRDKDALAPLQLAQRELCLAFTAGPAYQASYRAVAEQDFAGQLPAVQCPVVVFAGDADPLYSAVAPTVALLSNGLQQKLPGGERTYVCERQGDTVAGIIAGFFRQCGS
jgi:pimeloyl-ACP methyl ester carboxylesterase